MDNKRTTGKKPRNLIVAFDGTSNEFKDAVGSLSLPSNRLSQRLAEYQRREIVLRPGMFLYLRRLSSN